MRFRKLTPDERKRAWAEPESNAGAGWWPQGRPYIAHIDGQDPAMLPKRHTRDREPDVVEMIREQRRLRENRGRR